MQRELEGRAKSFVIAVIMFCRKLQIDTAMRELSRQIVRSAGSIGANYVEANEALSKKDFLLHLRIARKEAQETEFWLGVFRGLTNASEIPALQQEARELVKILTAIIKKSE